MKLELTQTVPLTILDNGAIRITGTRVSLDSIIYHYKLGKTPEAIHDSFPDVSLPDIHSIICYYLTHTATVEAYLQQQEKEADEIQQQLEAPPGYQQWRNEIRARIQQRWADRQASLAPSSTNGSGRQ